LSVMTARGNGTAMTHFILLGLTNRMDLQGVLFGLFLLIYTMTLIGNLGMMALIRSDPHLHTPMYFFLSTLAFIDVCYSSVVTPRLLVDFFIVDKSISYIGCMAQMAFFLLHGTAECLLLATMAYDRFVAICHPFLYQTLMSRETCVQLVAVAYTLSMANSAVQTSNVFRLPFCGPNYINHYFCDIPPLLQLSTGDTQMASIVVFLVSAVVVLSSFLLTLTSYTLIVSAICHIPSATGRHKAFSTCASHLAVVTIFYGTVIFMYIRPGSGQASNRDKMVSVFYAIIIPLLNPIIYTLRNRDFQRALGKALRRAKSQCSKQRQKAAPT
uniref:Olfactory receptor n=1 Tax=Pelusios castaneus TaxID=367368 RepID=A0A8C8RDZ1_9SAUR